MDYSDRLLVLTVLYSIVGIILLSRRQFTYELN